MWKDSLWVFPICLQFWKCCNKNVHLVRQHPSLGSMIARSTDTREISMSIPKFGQGQSIYICFNRVRIEDFTHPKWEGCRVISSIIFVVIRENISRLKSAEKQEVIFLLISGPGEGKIFCNLPNGYKIDARLFPFTHPFRMYFSILRKKHQFFTHKSSVRSILQIVQDTITRFLYNSI